VTWAGLPVGTGSRHR